MPKGQATQNTYRRLRRRYTHYRPYSGSRITAQNYASRGLSRGAWAAMAARQMAETHSARQARRQRFYDEFNRNSTAQGLYLASRLPVELRRRIYNMSRR